jgi:citrate synthase
MNEYAELGGNGKKTVLPLIEGTAGERAIDISKLRDQTGLITLDTGYGNTGSCLSAITFIAAFAYRRSRGLPIVYPKPQNTYSENLLHMMFSMPHADYHLQPEVVRALDLIFLLHADHEQNCSTSTVRMVASSKPNLFASVASGVCALWGPLHGGANQAVLEMLEQIHREGDDGSRFVEAAKNKKSGRRLMGFGHRVHKNYDSRAKLIKKQCDELLAALADLHQHGIGVRHLHRHGQDDHVSPSDDVGERAGRRGRSLILFEVFITRHKTNNFNYSRSGR